MSLTDPVPMRMRALPQSMWQEPNIPHNVSPATVYPVLPPLVTREGDDITGSFYNHNFHTLIQHLVVSYLNIVTRQLSYSI